MINNADDKCYNCNQNGHFIKDCTKVNNNDNFSKILLLQKKFIIKSEIIEIYKKKFNFLNNNNNNNIIIEENKSLEILALEIIIFNLEQKNKLKKIYELYNNEDFVKQVLIRLYDTRINMYLNKVFYYNKTYIIVIKI